MCVWSEAYFSDVVILHVEKRYQQLGHDMAQILRTICYRFFIQKLWCRLLSKKAIETIIAIQCL